MLCWILSKILHRISSVFIMFAQAERSLVCELIRRVWHSLACSGWFHTHHKLISNTSKKWLFGMDATRVLWRRWGELNLRCQSWLLSVPFLSFSILIFHDFPSWFWQKKQKLNLIWSFHLLFKSHSVCAFVVLSLVHVCCSANCQIYIHVVITSLSTELAILIKRHSFKRKTGQQAKQPAEKREGHRFNKYSGRSFHSDRTGGDVS